MSRQKGIAKDGAKFNTGEAAELGGIHLEKLKLGFLCWRGSTFNN